MNNAESIKHKIDMVNRKYKEGNKMEPTSVWKIEDIDKIWITQDGDEISLLVRNKDDITKITLIGDAIKNHNEQFVTALKADIDEERIKYEKEIKELEEKIKKLEHDDMLDKNAADYWSKEYDILLERFAKLQVENENEKLKQLKTPTIENFSNEEPADNVNHPSHYETGKFECIEVMQEIFGVDAVRDFCKCNAFKYIYRMDRKNGEEDVKKAIWYLNKYLELAKTKEG